MDFQDFRVQTHLLHLLHRVLHALDLVLRRGTIGASAVGDDAVAPLGLCGHHAREVRVHGEGDHVGGDVGAVGRLEPLLYGVEVTEGDGPVRGNSEIGHMICSMALYNKNSPY